jgi:hypothetical protein
MLEKATVVLVVAVAVLEAKDQGCLVMLAAVVLVVAMALQKAGSVVAAMVM